MNKKSKYYENLGSIISFIKNEYPIKVSKNFSTKVMHTIESNSEKYTTLLALILLLKLPVFLYSLL